MVNILVCGIDYEEGRNYSNDPTSNDGMTDMILYCQFDIKGGALRMRTLSFIFNNGEARSFGRRIAAFDAAARAEPWPACIHKIFWNAETVFDRLRYILYNVIIDSKE